MNVVAERNLFVNTSSVIQGDGRDVTINLPQGYADCLPNQQMKIALTSFNMEKKFYNINDTNRRFFMVGYDSAAASFNLQSRALQLPQGNYRAFGGRQPTNTALNQFFYDPRGLGYAIKTEILYHLGFEWNHATGVYTGVAGGLLQGNPTAGPTPDDLVVVEFNSNTQTYTITINFNTTSITSLLPNQTLFPSATIANFRIEFYSFEIPNYRIIPGNIIDAIITSNYEWSFVDTHELLGGCSQSTNTITTAAAQTDIENNLINKLFVSNHTGTVSTFETKFQACLRTTEAIYVRTNLPAENFQTASFDTGGNLYPYVIKSDILAKIPLPNPLAEYMVEFTPQNDQKPYVNSNYDYQLPWEYIHFQDDGSIFNAMLNTTHLSQIRIRITDDKGRLIPYESEEQVKCNELYFTATLKVLISQMT